MTAGPRVRRPADHVPGPRERGAPVRQGPARRWRHQGFDRRSHARQPARVRRRGLRRGQHRGDRRPGEHVRLRRGARLHPPSLRRLDPRDATVAAQPSLRRRAAREPSRVGRRALRAAPVHGVSVSCDASCRGSFPPDPVDAGDTSSTAADDVPDELLDAAMAEVHLRTSGSSSTRRAPAPTRRRCCTPTARRSSRAGGGPKRSVSPTTTPSSAGSPTSGRVGSP